MISRRTFLRGVSGTAAALGLLPGLRAWGSDHAGVLIPGTDGMIVRSSRFLDLEMPPEYANRWITPVSHFFVRNHMFEPVTLVADQWRLQIGGEVVNPVTLSLAELGKLQSHTVVNTLECAGNGRAFQNPHVPGIQWGKGAVGTARFEGPRLADVLHRAGIKSSGKHVMFHGLDEVPGKVPPFIRSIPIEKALDSDTLIATHMNGAPLTKHHGFPARALVPGWIGSASCKWLAEIKVLDREFEGNFMSPGYRMPNESVPPGQPVKPEDTHPLTALTVKSLIAGPAEGATVRSRTVQVYGTAWAGDADIVKVEISTDSGSSWHAAQLGRDQARYAWRLWSYAFRAPKPGEYVILSRATDNRGRTQPETPAWNPGGYLNNAIDQVRIHIHA